MHIIITKEQLDKFNIEPNFMIDGNITFKGTIDIDGNAKFDVFKIKENNINNLNNK